jgi:hypothetical protein
MAKNETPAKPHASSASPRRGGGHKLRDAFKIIGISEGTGHALIREGKIKVVRLGPRLPLITDREIDRILEEGVPT